MKHLQLAEQYRRQVRDGHLKPGDRLPSFAELRAQHGVSQDVLERMYRALEDEKLIVREHRRGIFVAEPQRAATASIGLVGFSTSKPRDALHEHLFGAGLYSAQLMHGIQTGARLENVRLTLLDEQSSVGWDKVDGVVALWNASAERIHELGGGDLPFVRMLLFYDGEAAVVADDGGGAKALAEHLLLLGHRRIACIRAGHTLSELRLEGYREALREAGIAPDETWLRALPPHDPDRDPPVDFVRMGQCVMEEWLQDNWKELGLTAVLAQNDQTAIGVIEACKRAGLRVPEDISVCGFDDTEAAQYVVPHLTTAHVPLFEMGQKSVELALQLKRSSKPQTIVLPTRLVVRESTTAPRV